MMYRQIVKPFFDITCALVLLIMALPVMLIVAILIRLDSSGPVIFMQERLGLNYRVFRLYKFRTMTHTQNRVKKQTFADDPEITRIGKFLRRSKLDELPQLFNIVNGDMSFVGPRPSLPDLQNRFDENGRERVKVKPGLSSLAAVSGGIFLTWPERWVYDRFYVENQSLWMDLRIIGKTVFVVLFGEKHFLKKPAEQEVRQSEG
jgi:undecaprenyl phosphate N,N'-diacetylbacillosamine 1-phosphate transferase